MLHSVRKGGSPQARGVEGTTGEMLQECAGYSPYHDTLYKMKIASFAFLSAVSLAFLLLKARFLTPMIGDQGVYEYAAWLWTEGVIPYRDFFISHPPTHLLLPVMAILIAGKNLAILDSVPSLLGIGSGILLFFIVRKRMNTSAGLIAATLFLFSYAHLVYSAHITGVEIAVFMILLSMFFSERKKMIEAGIALGLTLLSGAYTVPAIVAFLLLLLLENRNSFWKVFGVFVLSSSILHGIFVVVFGWEFIEQVYLYHLAKSGGNAYFASKASVVFLFAQKNAFLLLLAFLGIPSFFVSLRRWQRSEGDESQSTLWLMRFSLVVLGAYALFFLFAQSIFTHYFLLIIPFVAIAATFFLIKLTIFLPKFPLLVIGIILLVYGALNMRGFAANREQKRFDGLEEIVQFVSTTLEAESTIYGDFAIVPTIAFLSEKRIAAHEVDSSIMRFDSGASSLPSVLDAIEKDHVQLIISRPRRGIVIYPLFREYLERNYVIVRSFNTENEEKEIWVWKRK